jgi:hypothetical protein
LIPFSTGWWRHSAGRDKQAIIGFGPEHRGHDVRWTAGIKKHWEIAVNKQEVQMLSEEIEMLMAERARLLKVVGAAAILVANTDAKSLPNGVVKAAEMLSETLNALPEETLKDALESVRAEQDEA